MHKTFTARNKDGKTYRWQFWRDARPPAYWMLKDHEGHIRTLERTWIDSVPHIHAILESYGMHADIS